MFPAGSDAADGSDCKAEHEPESENSACVTAGESDRNVEIEKNDELHSHCCENWDPMKAVFDSFLNMNLNDDGLGGSNMTGNILCPHNNGKGGCFKSKCPYKHVLHSSETLRENPKLASSLSLKETFIVKNASSLPPQKLPATDCISAVEITATFDPSHFFVIPENGWRCLCSKHEHDGKLLTTEGQMPLHRNFYELRDNLQLMFKQSTMQKEKRNVFEAGELVAVRISSVEGDNQYWYRAKVINDTTDFFDQDNLAPVDVELELIDFGIRTSQSSADIFVLPEKLINRISPLAFECQLFGISPLMGTWSSAAVKRFQTLVTNQFFLIAEVVQPASAALSTTGKLKYESTLISLYGQSPDGTMIDVAQELINAGVGLEWNMYPKHTKINELLEGRPHRFTFHQ